MTQNEFVSMIRECHQKIILNKKETAMELGGISTETLDRMRRDNKICSKKVNGKIMFMADEIYRFLYEG